MILGSGIRKKPIPNRGSRGQKGTGSRIRIRNTAFRASFRLPSRCHVTSHQTDPLRRHESTIVTVYSTSGLRS
jgi:hypothetical protein